RKALPVPDDDAYARRAYEAPLAGIWAELLGVERVGRHDNFFELGGHSLLAVRLLVRLTEALAVELPLAILFAKPTLAELARESSISLITQEFDSHQLQKLLSSRSLK
ncbi:phosphopantetheine-binding protein, partial [Rhizobium ruizarguesonis]